MKAKKIPMRTCIVTKEKCPKKDLIRIVKTPNQTVEIDLTGKKNGKGAYLKLQEEVIQKSRQSKVLERALEITIPDEIYEELLSLLK